MIKRLLTIISLSAIFLLLGDFRIVKAQTHGAALLKPSSMDSAQSTNNDTVMTIATLNLHSLRLVVGLEEM